MRTIRDIELLLSDGKIETAYQELNEFLAANPKSAEGWYIMGGIYRAQELWGDAINSYNKAKLIEPGGPADAAIESIYDIIRFVNTDLMNP